MRLVFGKAVPPSGQLVFRKKRAKRLRGIMHPFPSTFLLQGVQQRCCCTKPPPVRRSTLDSPTPGASSHVMWGKDTHGTLRQSEARMGCAARSRQGLVERVSEQRAHSIGSSASLACFSPRRAYALVTCLLLSSTARHTGRQSSLCSGLS